MDSRILFLGTGGDSFTVGKQMRSSGGIVLNIEGTQFHIDPGPGSLVMAKMLGLNLRETTALFISGNDLFRTNDANAVISAMTHDGMDKRGVLICPTSAVLITEDVLGPFVNNFYKGCLEKTILLENTKKLGISNVDIEIIELKESLSKEAGFRFITPRFSIGYIPDTSYKNDLAESYKNTDILIISIQDPRNFKRKEHLNCEDAQKIISEVKPQIAIITGFGIKMLQADPLYEARLIQKETGVHVIAAKDGMTLNPVSFTTAVRQQSLTTY
jgi:ribonuclease BN (tRNA processing enzyme)